MKRLIILCCMALLGLNLSTVNVGYAQDSSVFFQEAFDSVTPPTLPAGWLDADSLWESSSSVASTGSGQNNLTIAGGQTASVTTPVIDLSGLTTGTLSYLARRTSTYPMDSLLVSASTDGGISFSTVLLDVGAALPASDGSYVEISTELPAVLIGETNVMLMFTALGGSTSGSNIRIDDVAISGEGDPVFTESAFGFSLASSSTDASASTFEVELQLDFSNSENLQGLQFSIDWDNPNITLQDVSRGNAIADEVDWRLTFDARTGEMRGVLLGDQTNNLATGVYNPLITLIFEIDPANTANEVVLTLNEVVGALSVRTGDDAGLGIGIGTHTVSISSSGNPTFEPDATQLNFGSVDADSTDTAQITIANNGGSDLVISNVVASNDLYSISPLTATVPAGGAQVFDVSFTPIFTIFGYQDGDVIFTHNAPSGSDSLQLEGIGVNGLGDVSGDGAVDVLDIVLAIDFVLDTSTPSSTQVVSGDVFPYAAADDVLDIRDLTVLAQAIVFDAWPDELPLPAAPTNVAIGAKPGRIGTHVRLVEDGDDTRLEVQLSEPARALQFALAFEEGSERLDIEALALAEGLQRMHYVDREGGRLNVILYRVDGQLIEAGRHALFAWPSIYGVHGLLNEYSISVDQAHSRSNIGFEDFRSTYGEDDPFEEAEMRDFAPYPNPLRVDQDEKLLWPVEVLEPTQIRAEVFDLLGRKVSVMAEALLQPGTHAIEWNGHDDENKPVAPGLYLLRMVDGKKRMIRKIIVR